MTDHLVLSLDGGGIRGVATLTAIDYLEKAAGVPACKMFDLIVGTSTGGIAALALAKGVPASDVIQMYVKKGSTIFNRGWVRERLDHFGLLRSKYPASGIESVLNEFFGPMPISAALTKVMVTSVDARVGKPHFVRSWDPRDGFLWMSAAARMTSAAPTYFPPASGYVDGGVVANDPAMIAYTEASKLWPGEVVRLLSIGTGFMPFRAENAKDPGAIRWLRSIVDLMMDGAMGTVEYEMLFMIGDNDRYWRIQEPIPSYVNHCMDDASAANIAALRRFGAEEFIGKHKSALDGVARLLKAA